MSDATDHIFGGEWTEQKLEALKRYFDSYTTALKNQPFQTMYIDGFAGTGYRQQQEDEDSEQTELLETDLGDETREFLDGSARLALKSDPGFDYYVFIEKRADHVDELEKLSEEFPDKTIRILPGDANEEVDKICRRVDWRKWRAVCFLDPYGMQVEWSTLKAISETESIDLWLLVPIGSALIRMLPNSGQVPENWKPRLDRFFGTDEWQTAVYPSKPSSQRDLFSGNGPKQTKARESIENIEKYLIERLEELFPAVMDEPLRLRKPNGQWLFSLFFAVSSPNKKAQGIALNIADYITKLVEETPHGQ